MICALNYQGKFYFLDATESYIGFGQYAQRIEGRQVLIENGNSYLLQRIPTPACEQNEVHHKYDLQLNGTTLTGQVSQVWKGENKEDILMQANAIHKNKLEESLLEFLSRGNKDYIISGMKQDGLDNRNADLSFQYKLVYNNAATAFDKDNSVKPISIPPAVERIICSTARATGSRRRTSRCLPDIRYSSYPQDWRCSGKDTVSLFPTSLMAPPSDTGRPSSSKTCIFPGPALGNGTAISRS
jgi:hypothetical protein